MAEPEPPTSSGTVDAQEHARVLKNFVDLSDQFAAANEVLSALGRSAGDPDAVLTTVVESARRLCRSQAAHLYVLEDGVYRLIKAVGLSEESHPVHRRAPDAPGPGHAARAGGAGPQGPADPRRAGRRGLRPARPPAGGRVPHHHGRADAPRRRGRRRPERVALRGEPVRRAGDGHRLGVRRAGGHGRQRRQAGPAARGAGRRAGEEGRRSRGAARGRRGGQLQPRRRQRAVHHRQARGASSRRPTAARSWSTPSRTAASWCAAPTGRRPASSSGCARSASTWTRPSSDAPPGNADRSPCRTSAPSLSTRTCRSCTTTAGARWSRCRCSARASIVGSLIVRRKRTGDFTEETLDLLETFASQSALRPAERPALPRAEGTEPGAGARQPAQVGVPRQHVPRAPDAAERGARVLRGAPRADVRRAQRTPGGVPARHPQLGPPPAGAPQRDPRPLEDRGREDGPGVLVDRPAVPARRRGGDAARAGGHAGGRRSPSTSPTTSTSCTPTCSGSSRSCST